MHTKDATSFFSSKRQFILYWLIRILIVISILYEIGNERWGIVVVNILALLFSFIPLLIEKIFSISVPTGFGVIFLISFLISIYFEKLYIGVFVQFILGVLFGFIGFIIMYVLYMNSRIKTSYIFVLIFSFSFSVSIGVLWELFRYSLMNFFSLKVGELNANYVIYSLVFTIIGALIASVFGFIFLRSNGQIYLHRIAQKFVRNNPKLFFEFEDSYDNIINIIRKGENEKIEFKSTLRTNLHTKQIDKKMEYEVLKTIVAFLNSNGGILLLGVSDKGGIVGIEKDGFTNTDGFYRHFTNLFKTYIGNEYLPFIKTELITIENRNVFKIICLPIDNEVFLKTEGREEFYVRSGPSSVKLEGSKLISYINQKFKKHF
jgi:hypothetical protein